MRQIVSLLGAAALAVSMGLATLPSAAAGQPDDQPVLVPKGDADMNSAIAKARASLPVFWAAFDRDAAGTTGFLLKVRISDGRHTEHFWTEDIERADGRIFGKIANDPEFVTTVAYGQRIEVNEADISDWMFYRDGKVVGGETIRVLLARMPADKRAAFGLEFEVP